MGKSAICCPDKKIQSTPHLRGDVEETLTKALQGLGVSQTMEFLANAHAASYPNAGRNSNDAVAWQLELLPTCSIPAGDTLLVGGAAAIFDARTFLHKCCFEDLE
jgi:hypothetical protein